MLKTSHTPIMENGRRAPREKRPSPVSFRGALPLPSTLQADDLLDVALSALQWSTDATLPQAERAMAQRLFTLAVSLSEQEAPAPHEASMVKAMICHLCKASERLICNTCPFGYCG